MISAAAFFSSKHVLNTFMQLTVAVPDKTEKDERAIR